jgi:hypothetical protein
MDIHIGDTVTFEAKGRNWEGVVTRVRVKHSRKMARLEERLGIRGERSYAHRIVAEVTVDKSIWTVPCDRCKVKGKAKPDEILSARLQANAVKSSINNRIAERKNRNYEAARAANMLYVEAGTPIEVQYRDVGWVRVTFLRHNTSGGVVFRDRWGRERRVSPAYARLPISASAEAAPAPAAEPSIDLLKEFSDLVGEEI